MFLTCPSIPVTKRYHSFLNDWTISCIHKTSRSGSTLNTRIHSAMTGLRCLALALALRLRAHFLQPLISNDHPQLPKSICRKIHLDPPHSHMLRAEAHLFPKLIPRPFVTAPHATYHQTLATAGTAAPLRHRLRAGRPSAARPTCSTGGRGGPRQTPSQEAHPAAARLQKSGFWARNHATVERMIARDVRTSLGEWPGYGWWRAT